MQITNRTEKVDKVTLEESLRNEILRKRLYTRLRDVLKEHYDSYFDREWIPFYYTEPTEEKREKWYWNRKTELAIPVQENYNTKRSKCLGKEPYVYGEEEAAELFGENCPSEITAGIENVYSMGGYLISLGLGRSWSLLNRVLRETNGYAEVNAAHVSQESFEKKILSGEYGISSESENPSQKPISYLRKKEITELEKLQREDIDELIEKLGEEETREKAKKDLEGGNLRLSEEEENSYIETLLACDKERADLEIYNRKCLEDVNAGHWELWDEEESGEKGSSGNKKASLSKPLVARNPIADIHEDGLIGIDFGTKSTIVSKMDGKEKITLLRIGIGDLAKEVAAYHYENPTIMEFINFGKFLEDYQSKSGRPKTSINDVRVSHAANADLKSCANSDEFYSYFYDIKQWCGDTERNVKIVDKEGQEYLLPAFVELGKNENNFDPLEIYAYYLGLYINNMHNGIYLDYVLSFSVTYEKEVKEKILDSFEKGLKKSLPECIWSNQDVCSKFRVRLGVSEPAAYAITALKGYGFEQNEEEQIFYGIFDFGGGTTDFDFGLWRLADDSREEENYDYVITHFGSEGDKYLGGENLLELMAFEIFKANAKKMREEKYSFFKPKECDEFPGSELLLSNSQEARRNTKELMEVLRPFWEGIIAPAPEGESSQEQEETDDGDTSEGNGDDGQTPGEEKNPYYYEGYLFRNTDDNTFPIKDEKIKVNLIDNDGNYKSSVELDVSAVNLVQILEERIEKGVDNFFQASRLAFREKELENGGIDKIHIFLAGNSSKSPILKKIFEEHMKREEEEIGEMNGDRAADQKRSHELFPPLGTKEAWVKQRERDVETEKNDISAPTGKTGVAYGLIEGRQGGKIKVISEVEQNGQTKFRYNIGSAKRGKFAMKLERNKVSYGQWIRFCNASVEDFEIYYSSLPNAGNMNVDDDGILKKRLRLPQEWVSAEKDVYIRTIEEHPEDIEFCVAEQESEPKEGVDVQQVHLGE